MKKSIIFGLTFLLCLFGFIFTTNINAYEDQTIVFTYDKAELNPSDSHTTIIRVSENSRLSTFEVTLAYDSNIITVTNASLCEGVAATCTVNYTTEAGKIRIIYNGNENLVEETELLKIDYTVNSNAPLGSTFTFYPVNEGNPIFGSLEGGNSIVEIPLEAINFDSKTISIGKIGDVNGDGEVNNRDLIAIHLHLAGLKNLDDTALTLADVDRNGKVNTFDTQYILNYIIGTLSSFDEIVQKKEYIVEFYGFNGELLSSQKVTEGSSAKEPTLPEIAGYRFIGWDNDFSYVTSNMTINAVYEQEDNKEYFKVLFFGPNNEVISEQKVRYGEGAKEPEPHTYEGYVLLGWNRVFDKITSDTEVYGAFERINETVIASINEVVNCGMDGIYQTYSIFGQIVAISKAGIILSDGTANIYVHMGSTGGLEVGEKIQITGTSKLSRNTISIDCESYNYGIECEDVNNEIIIRDFAEYENVYQVQKVNVTGLLVKNGSYYNLILPGTEFMGSIIDAGAISDIDSYINTMVTITGYDAYVSTSTSSDGKIKRYIQYMVEEFYSGDAEIESGYFIAGNETYPLYTNEYGWTCDPFNVRGGTSISLQLYYTNGVEVVLGSEYIEVDSQISNFEFNPDKVHDDYWMSNPEAFGYMIDFMVTPVSLFNNYWFNEETQETYYFFIEDGNYKATKYLNNVYQETLDLEYGDFGIYLLNSQEISIDNSDQFTYAEKIFIRIEGFIETIQMSDFAGIWTEYSEASTSAYERTIIEIFEDGRVEVRHFQGEEVVQLLSGHAECYDGQLHMNLVSTSADGASTTMIYQFYLSQSRTLVSDQVVSEFVKVPETISYSEIEVGSEVAVRGTIVASYYKGFVITDFSGNQLLIYTAGTSAYEVGSEVVVSGVVSTYANANQISSPVIYNVGFCEYIDQQVAVELTLEQIEELAIQSSFTPFYAKLSGTFTFSGKYYNLIIEGSSLQGSLQAGPENEKFVESYLNSNVAVYGYITGVSSSKYIQFVVTDMNLVEVDDQYGMIEHPTSTYYHTIGQVWEPTEANQMLPLTHDVLAEIGNQQLSDNIQSLLDQNQMIFAYYSRVIITPSGEYITNYVDGVETLIDLNCQYKVMVQRTYADGSVAIQWVSNENIVTGNLTPNGCLALPDNPSENGLLFQGVGEYYLFVIEMDGTDSDGVDFYLGAIKISDNQGGENANPEETKKYYTVEFVDYYGKIISKQSVEEGHSAYEPTNVEVEGMEFIRWDQDFSCVTSDMTIYPIYEKIDDPSTPSEGENNGGSETEEPTKKFYTVEFVDYYGKIIDKQSVEEGQSAHEPEMPAVEGYTFLGWSEDFSCVTNDMVVSPRYEKIDDPSTPSEGENNGGSDENTPNAPDQVSYTVQFIDYYGYTISEQIVEEGSAAIAPEIPSISGMEFVGWSEDFSCVTNDMVISPLYVEMPDQTIGGDTNNPEIAG